MLTAICNRYHRYNTNIGCYACKNIDYYDNLKKEEYEREKYRKWINSDEYREIQYRKELARAKVRDDCVKFFMMIYSLFLPVINYINETKVMKKFYSIPLTTKLFSAYIIITILQHTWKLFR
jgi:hypothetical protein